MCSTVQLGVRDSALFMYERQTGLSRPVCNSSSIFNAAFALFTEHRPLRSVRSLSVRASGLAPADDTPQLSFYPEDNKALRWTDLERAVDKIRGKYGYESIRRGIQFTDSMLDLDAKGDHIIHPTGFLGTLS